jgi:putative membrane protein
MINAKTPHVFLVVAALACVGACSKDEPSTEAAYGQPAASAGDEMTPKEPAPVVAETPAPVAPAAVQPETPTSAGPAATTAPATPSLALTNEQIVKITAAVDSGEIEQAKLAKNKAKNPRVKKFAAHMIEQHTQAKQKGAQLAKKANITPADSNLASELQTKGNQQLEMLKTADATAFDSTYMNGQVEQHQEVLSMLTTQLIPAATSDELKASLTEAQTMVQSHLSQAQEIRQALAAETHAQ